MRYEKYEKLRCKLVQIGNMLGVKNLKDLAGIDTYEFGRGIPVLYPSPYRLIIHPMLEKYLSPDELLDVVLHEVIEQSIVHAFEVINEPIDVVHAFLAHFLTVLSMEVGW